MNNSFELKMKSIATNEAFARHVIGEFVLDANPTIEELEDIKTAVSEAVTNAIVHGYNGKENGEIILKCSMIDKNLEIIVKDNGVGIQDIGKALEPFYTTKPSDERSGMGFTLMKSFMTELSVESQGGVTVKMTKILGEEEDNARAQ